MFHVERSEHENRTWFDQQKILFHVEHLYKFITNCYRDRISER